MTDKRWHLVAGLLMFSLLATMGCGGDDDDGAAAEAAGDDSEDSATVDPCELLTLEESEEILDGAVLEPNQGEVGVFSTCTWVAESNLTADNPADKKFIFLELLGSFPGGAEAFYDNVSSTTERQIEEMPVGDEAFFSWVGGRMDDGSGTIVVREGDVLFRASLTSFAEEAARDKAEELAELVAERLD
jgi:hypothetical protein